MVPPFLATHKSNLDASESVSRQPINITVFFGNVTLLLVKRKRKYFSTKSQILRLTREKPFIRNKDLQGLIRMGKPGRFGLLLERSPALNPVL